MFSKFTFILFLLFSAISFPSFANILSESKGLENVVDYKSEEEINEYNSDFTWSSTISKFIEAYGPSAVFFLSIPTVNFLTRNIPNNAARPDPL